MNDFKYTSLPTEELKKLADSIDINTPREELVAVAVAVIQRVAEKNGIRTVQKIVENNGFKAV